MPDQERRVADRLQVVQSENLRDATDLRDIFYRPALLSLPARYTPAFLQSSSTRSLIRIRDQGISERCTGYALASLIDMQRVTDTVRAEEDTEVLPVSSQMLFEMGAMVSAEIRSNEKQGYNIRSAIKGFYHNGVCLESDWPEGQDSNQSGFDMVRCFKRARGHSLGAYFRLEHRLADYHSAIGEVGAILVSAHLHAGWRPEAVKSHRCIEPADDFADYGAHAFVIVGYDQTGFYVLNSWGKTWAGDVADRGEVPGVAHWSYKDWAETVIDAWVLRLAVPTPDAFEYTQGAHGSAYFGSARSGMPQATADSMAADPVSVPRQHVLGHYIHFEAGEYVRTGSYPDSNESLYRTMNYLHSRLVEDGCEEDDINRVYLRISGDTGSVKNAMHRISKLRRVLRPKGVYPITIVWTARMASAFAIGIKACMKEAVARMPNPSSARNDLIESLLRPLGRPLWNQMKLEAAAVASVDELSPGPLARTLLALNATLDERMSRNLDEGSGGVDGLVDGPLEGESVNKPAGRATGKAVARSTAGTKARPEIRTTGKTSERADPLPEKRIELVVEGAGALVFLEFLSQAQERAIWYFRHVNRIHLAFPVANHRCFVRSLKRLRHTMGTSHRSRQEYNSLVERIILLRPSAHFLASSSIGPYTQTWFHLVNNSFESTPLRRSESEARKSLSLASEKEYQLELVGLGIKPEQQISAGPTDEKPLDGAAILRNSVVDKAFLQCVLSGNWEADAPPEAKPDQKRNTGHPQTEGNRTPTRKKELDTH